MAKGDANFGAAGKKGYMGGKYSRKAMNLSKKELGKAGVAAASKRTVKISQTSRSDGKTLGPGGKPLTGRVKMGNGNIAVYKAGKRVIAQAAKKATPTVTRKPAPPAKKTDAPPVKKVDKINTRQARDRAMANRPRGSVVSAPRSMSNVTPSNYTGMSVNKPGSTYKEQRGIADDIRRRLAGIGSSSSKPKTGDIKQTMAGTSIYNGSNWVKAVKRKGKWVAA
jgi:hypothetical protein